MKNNDENGLLRSTGKNEGKRNGSEPFNSIIRTVDGKCVLFWIAVFLFLLLHSIVLNGWGMQQIKYMFFSIISFLLFARFRVTTHDFHTRLNIWGVVNVNAFGVLIIYLEFFHA